MAIEQELQAILEARYGKDVRQNIHDAIQTCYDEGRAGVIDHVARSELPFKADLENGQVKLSQIPQVALDNLVKVQTDADRFALTTAEVQTGDTVKVIETDLMYLVVDDTKLDSEDGYTGYSASVDWETIFGRPEGVVGAQGVTPPVEITDPAPLYRADVVDNLNSTDTDKPLSANMGKELSDRKSVYQEGTVYSDLTLPAGTNKAIGVFDDLTEGIWLFSVRARVAAVKTRIRASLSGTSGSITSTSARFEYDSTGATEELPRVINFIDIIVKTDAAPIYANVNSSVASSLSQVNLKAVRLV